MNKYFKKMLPAIIVTVILIIYFVLYFCLLISLVKGFLKIVFAVIPIAMIALIIAVCYERIKEIRSGEEDDLSKY